MARDTGLTPDYDTEVTDTSDSATLFLPSHLWDGWVSPRDGVTDTSTLTKGTALWFGQHPHTALVEVSPAMHTGRRHQARPSRRLRSLVRS